MIPSAKEYYETQMAASPELKSQADSLTLDTLSSIHSVDIREIAREGHRHYDGTPRPYCVCPRTSELVSELIAVYPDELRREVESVYVVKSYDYRANAFAHFRTGDYRGYLVTYWEGLNILFHMTSVLYAEYYDIQDDRICAERGWPKTSKLPNSEKRQRHRWNIATFLSFADTCRLRDFDLRLTPQIDFSTYEDTLWMLFFNACIAFAVAHEIGHHILNHTASTAGASIRAFVSLPPDLSTVSGEHRIEFEADLFAAKSLCLLRDTSELYKAYMMYVSPLLALGSLGLLLGEPTADSVSHPSISRRYANVARYLDTDNPVGYGREILNAFMWNMFGNQARNDNIEQWWNL